MSSLGNETSSVMDASTTKPSLSSPLKPLSLSKVSWGSLSENEGLVSTKKPEHKPFGLVPTAVGRPPLGLANTTTYLTEAMTGELIAHQGFIQRPNMQQQLMRDLAGSTDPTKATASIKTHPLVLHTVPSALDTLPKPCINGVVVDTLKLAAEGKQQGEAVSGEQLSESGTGNSSLSTSLSTGTGISTGTGSTNIVGTAYQDKILRPLCPRWSTGLHCQFRMSWEKPIPGAKTCPFHHPKLLLPSGQAICRMSVQSHCRNTKADHCAKFAHASGNEFMLALAAWKSSRNYDACHDAIVQRWNEEHPGQQYRQKTNKNLQWLVDHRPNAAEPLKTTALATDRIRQRRLVRDFSARGFGSGSNRGSGSTSATGSGPANKGSTLLRSETKETRSVEDAGGEEGKMSAARFTELFSQLQLAHHQLNELRQNQAVFQQNVVNAMSQSPLQSPPTPVYYPYSTQQQQMFAQYSYSPYAPNLTMAVPQGAAIPVNQPFSLGPAAIPVPVPMNSPHPPHLQHQQPCAHSLPHMAVFPLTQAPK